MRLMLVLALVLSATACAKKPAPKSPAPVEREKAMEPGETTESGAAPDADSKDTMQGDPCDGGESK